MFIGENANVFYLLLTRATDIELIEFIELVPMFRSGQTFANQTMAVDSSTDRAELKQEVV